MFKLILKFIITQDSPPAGNCKRRTARTVTCPGITCPGGGVQSCPGWLGEGYPILDRGYPILSCSGWGVPHLVMTGVPPCLDWRTLQKGPVTSESIMGWRWGTPREGDVTSGIIMGGGWGTPPGANRLKTLPSPSF